MAENIEPQLNNDESLPAEIELENQEQTKSEEIPPKFIEIMTKSFFPNEFGENNISINAEDGINNIRINVIIKPNPYELEEFSSLENFSLMLDGRAYLKFFTDENSGRKYKKLIFANPKFSFKDRVLDFGNFCPKGTKLVISENIGNSPLYRLDEKEVTSSSLSCIEDFIGILHEIGHAIDDQRRGVKNAKEDEKNYGIAGAERNAWAEALKISKKLGIPTDFVRKQMQDWLQSHQNRNKKASITNDKRKRERKM